MFPHQQYSLYKAVWHFYAMNVSPVAIVVWLGLCYQCGVVHNLGLVVMALFMVMLFIVLRITDERQMDGTLNTVFIGGLSADLTIPYEHSKSRDYIGCMRDFFINGNRIQLLGEGQRRLESYNVVRGCNLDQSRLCGAECTSEGCIDFLLDSDPVCDCILSPASCTADGQ